MMMNDEWDDYMVSDFELLILVTDFLLVLIIACLAFLVALGRRGLLKLFNLTN